MSKPTTKPAKVIYIQTTKNPVKVIYVKTTKTPSQGHMSKLTTNPTKVIDLCPNLQQGHIYPNLKQIQPRSSINVERSTLFLK